MTVPNAAEVAERIWFGRGAASAAMRAVLRPASFSFGAVVRARNLLYDRGIVRAESLGIPSISVGNLTVGGTGKTPVSAWIASRLAEAGATPAIALRGYGGDEPLVHALLNPTIPVVANADRRIAARDAAGRGADVLVLDDAFQHRRVRRDVDLVLVSAEQCETRERLLPAGPYRERAAALGRATAVVVTRKTASDAAVRRAVEWVVGRGGVARPDVATIALTLDALTAWTGNDHERASAARESPVHASVTDLNGRRVLAIAAIGAPHAFFAQLASHGAQVDGVHFADHHAFSPRDVVELARRADGADRVVCTLKDAVKLGPRWPRLAPTLWYVSQRLTVEDGHALLDTLFARLLDLRAR